MMATASTRMRLTWVFHEVGVARAAAVAGTLFVALALQTTVLSQVTLLGVIPQVLLVVVVTLAYVDGERMGVVAGFTAGLLVDLSLPQGSIAGLTAFVYTLIGYAVGSLRRFSASESVWTPLLAVALASAAAETSYGVLSILLGQPWLGPGLTARVVGLVVLYNTLLTPFTFPAVRWIAIRFRPEKVHR